MTALKRVETDVIETTGRTEYRVAHIRSGRLYVRQHTTSRWIGESSSATYIYDYTLSDLHGEMLCYAHELDLRDGSAADPEQTLADMELESVDYLRYSHTDGAHYVRRVDVGPVVG